MPDRERWSPVIGQDTEGNMRALDVNRYALSVIAAAMLAGCGGGSNALFNPLSAGPSTALRVTTAERTRSDATYKVLYSFGGSGDGELTLAGLVNVKGTLYGTTDYGGGSGCAFHLGCGTVFSVSTTGAEKVSHISAARATGSAPVASLLNVNGTLYGTTIYGGTSNCSYMWNSL